MENRILKDRKKKNILLGIIQAETNSELINYPVSLNHDHPKKIILLNVGNIIVINDKYYVLTCYHCIKNTINIKILISTQKYICHTEVFSDELDLALLSIDSYVPASPPYDLNDFDKENINNFPRRNHKFHIESTDIKYFKKKNKYKRKIFECSSDFTMTVDNCSHLSLNMPKIPYISFTLKHNIDDIHELQGISGSLLINNNGVYGMVNSVENSSIHAIPSCVLLRFINEFRDKNKFQGLCTFIGKFVSCEYKPNDSNIKHDAIYVEDCLDINYNNFEYENKINCMNLRNGDIIVEIDGHKIDTDGLIGNYDLKTYIAMNYYCGNIISLKILRCKNNDNDYKEKKINIRSRPLSSMKYISVSFNHKIYNYYGFIFVELSEDIINFYNNMGIIIGYSFSQTYINNPYRNNDSEKVVVLLNINKNEMSNEIIDKINELGIPLVRLDKDYTLPVLNKINKKKVDNIDDLISITQNSEDNTFNFIISEKMFKLEIKDNKIKTIK